MTNIWQKLMLRLTPKINAKERAIQEFDRLTREDQITYINRLLEVCKSEGDDD